MTNNFYFSVTLPPKEGWETEEKVECAIDTDCEVSDNSGYNSDKQRCNIDEPQDASIITLSTGDRRIVFMSVGDILDSIWETEVSGASYARFIAPCASQPSKLVYINTSQIISIEEEN